MTEMRRSSKRTLSASSLKDRLSMLSTTPLRPVAALRANIEFVPSKIPRKRRFQTLAVLTWSLMMVLTGFAFLYLCSLPPLWPVLAVYMTWVVLIDKSPVTGGRSSLWFRQARFWRYFSDYYPASLIKECDLPADRPYVFGYHPHGIIGMGAMATFATDGIVFTLPFEITL